MPTIIQGDPLADDGIEVKRAIIREALDDIAQEVGSRLKEVDLNVPIFLSVPSDGEGKVILTLASPIDPSEGDWLSVSAIVCEVAGRRLNGIILIGREIRSSSNMPKMKVAEVTAD
jgi:hypothetical protein